MTNSIPYDGVGKLSVALAALYGYSPKSNNINAKLIGEAKAALGITSKASVLPDGVKLAIYRWHYERVNPGEEQLNDDPQAQSVETISQPEPDSAVEIISHDDRNESVELNSQATDSHTVDIISQSNDVEIIPQHPTDTIVETISQSTPNEDVEINSQYGFNDLVRVAFYTTSGGARKRQVIALDGFYINALMLAAGIGKADVPKWVQHAVDNWPAFDPLLPITKQVKYLIIRELTNAIRR